MYRVVLCNRWCFEGENLYLHPESWAKTTWHVAAFRSFQWKPKNTTNKTQKVQNKVTFTLQVLIMSARVQSNAILPSCAAFVFIMISHIAGLVQMKPFSQSFVCERELWVTLSRSIDVVWENSKAVHDLLLMADFSDQLWNHIACGPLTGKCSVTLFLLDTIVLSQIVNQVVF